MDTPDTAAAPPPDTATMPLNTGAAGGAEVHGLAVVEKTAEEIAAEQAALDAEAKAKAEADAMEAKRLEDEAAHKAEEDRIAAEKAQADEDAAAEAANAPKLRTDGPTLSEFVESGEEPADYPPRGFAVVTDESRAAERPNHPMSRIHYLEKRLADLERKFKALHL